MAVVLRLARHGQKKRPFYRIVAAEKTCRRDGRFIEIVGTYNPLTDPPAVTLKEDRIRHWISVGAQTSRLVSSVIRKNMPGPLEERTEHQRTKIQARRKKRKEKLRAKSA